MDYVAVGFDVAGNVKAFTTGTLEICKAAAKCYRRREKSFRVYPVVKIMPVDEWERSFENGCYQLFHE